MKIDIIGGVIFMKFSKAISKSEALLKDYLDAPDPSLLSGFNKLSNNIHSKGYLLNIKFLYLYQVVKVRETLPNWYVLLAKQKMKELDDYFNASFQNILQEAHLETNELNHFFNQRIAWIYKGKFRVYPITPLDYLPLLLRLKVYVFLYENEDDAKARCHLRNRISVTLAKLGHLELANFYSVYNWLIAQDVANTHFAKSSNLKHSLQSQKYASQSSKQLTKERQEVTPVTELSYYFTQLLNPKNMRYDRANVATIDLIVLYYKQYPQLQELSLPLKTYLRTKDQEEFYEKVAQKRMKFIRNVANLPYHLKEMTLTPMNQDQLAIYNYLLRITQ